jgi:hypothetical protein
LSALEEYLASADPRAAQTVRALAGAIRKAAPELDSAIKYRILMYSLKGDWRNWVVAINARKNGISLQFLAGVLLSDQRKVLRKGTSVLRTWDFDFDERVDPQAVGEYVREAVARYPEYKQNNKEILDAARKPRRA